MLRIQAERLLGTFSRTRSSASRESSLAALSSAGSEDISARPAARPLPQRSSGLREGREGTGSEPLLCLRSKWSSVACVDLGQGPCPMRKVSAERGANAEALRQSAGPETPAASQDCDVLRGTVLHRGGERQIRSTEMPATCLPCRSRSALSPSSRAWADEACPAPPA